MTLNQPLNQTPNQPFASRRTALYLIALLALAAGLSSFATAQTPAAPAPPPAPATLPPMNGIAHIAIRVKDIAASVAFYHKLGFDQAFANLGRDGVTVSQSFVKLNDRQYIELYPDNAQNPAQSESIFMHLCFEGADLNALHDYYVAEGLTPIAVRTAGAGNLLFTMKGPQQFADPQNIEYTQYMPGSKHTLEFGKLNGPDRVGDKMTVVVLDMQDPAAARDFYLTKMGFTPNKTNPALLDLPGTSGESVQIVPVSELGARSSIVLTTPDLDKSAAQLTRQQVEFKRASATTTDAKGKTRTVDMISITDPDNNIIRLQSTK
jgi:catechol 2,3-dioxygenase-like lactoylglutathione lyase family enzyme